MKIYAVKKGTYHMWGKSKIVKIFDTYEEADRWIKANIKQGQHMYVDIVTEVKRDGLIRRS